MVHSRQSDATLRDVYRLVFRHKWKALILFLTVVTAVTLYTIFCPRTYRSEGKLFVRLGRENVTLDPTATLGQEPAVAVPPSRENEINSVVEILRSRVLVERVVDAIGPRAILEVDDVTPPGGDAPPEGDVASPEQLGGQHDAPDAEPKPRPERFGLFTNLSDRERAIIKLMEHMGVEPGRKSNVIRISYDGHSPELSRAVVAKFMDFFLDQHIRLNRADGAREFLAQQTANLLSDLTRAEKELRDLKDETGFASVEEQRRIMATRIGRLEDELIETTAAKAATESEVQALRATLAGLPESQVTSRITGVADEGTDGMREQFYALQLKEREMAAKYTDAHPLMQEIRHQIAGALEVLNQEERTRSEVTTGPARPFEEVQLALLSKEPALSSLEVKADTLRAELAEVRGELKTLNESERRIAKLQREIDLQDTNYRKYSVTLEQARIDEALGSQRISNISVVQPATYALKPVRPRKLINLMLGVLVGGLGSLGLAVLAEHLDHSFKTPEDIERKLELPVLVSIPDLNRELLLSGRN